VVSKSSEAKHKIDLYRNFGHDGPNHFDGPGINGKNSELNAALGLAILPYASEIISKRKAQWAEYRKQLARLGEEHFLSIPEHTNHNGAYFPVIGLDAKTVEKILEALAEKGIEGRRYFNPSLNTIAYLKGEPCPISESIAETVFCLPMHHFLKPEEQAEISNCVLAAL
jgi:dTDP-4-amino-4,6-dideoxygalactose transaminase